MANTSPTTAGGIDPVSAIANGVGSIFNFLSAGQQTKQAKEATKQAEAQKDAIYYQGQAQITTQGLLNTNAYNSALFGLRDRELQIQQVQAEKNPFANLIWAGALVVLVLAALLIYNK
jgi:cytochrome c biogenesis factor